MGQQSSRKSNSGGGGVGCGCGCGWERRPHTSHVHRYVAAITDRWGSTECSCRRRRACVCTAYRDLSEIHDERLAAVLTLGAGDLRRELDAIVTLNAESDLNRESGEPVPELFVLSVAPRSLDSDGSQHSLRSDLQQASDASLRLHQHLVMCGSGELKAMFVRAQNNVLPAKVHTQVDYIHRLVEDLQEITSCSFYWGKMDRYEAERLLDGKPEGTFLLRDSAQEEHLFSVSFRKYGRSLHARIEHFESRFSFDSHDPAVYSARTVTRLLEHYKDPACVMFFEPILTAPLPRSYAFSLQQLSRAVIVSRITYDGVEELPLPPRLRAYLKEYHYRQRVRVRRLDSDVLYHHPC